MFVSLCHLQTEFIRAKALTFLPNDKMLEWSKLKAFADDKIIAVQKLKFVNGRVKNTMGKGGKVISIFSFFHNVLKKPSSLGGR